MKRVLRDIFAGLVASMSCGVSSAFAQGLDLDPKSAQHANWTCVSKFSTSGGGGFGELSAKLLQRATGEDEDAAARLVLALTLRKVELDTEFLSLPSARRDLLLSGVDELDGISLSDTVRALQSLLSEEIRDSSPWLVRAPAEQDFVQLAEVFGQSPSEAGDACLQLDRMSKAGMCDPGEILSGVNVRALLDLLQAPAAQLPERTRDRVLECLKAALIEAKGGSYERLAMLGDLAEIGSGIRELKGVSLTQVNRAYDTLMLESPDLPREMTRERMRRLRQLVERANVKPPDAEQLALVRPLKPAYAQLVPLFRIAQKSIAPAALRLLDSSESLNDPAIMGVDSALLAVRTDIETLGHISGAMSEKDVRGRSVIREDCSFAAARMLDVIKRASRAKDVEKEEKLNEFRALCSMVEAALMAPNGQAIRGDRRSSVANALIRLESAQREYLQALSDSRRSPDEKLVRTLEAGAASFNIYARSQMPDPSAVLAWPAVELTAEGLRMLRDDLDRDVDDLMEHYAAARLDQVAIRIREIERRHSAALAIADLCRALQRTGIAPGGALDEIAAGSPDPFRVIGGRNVDAFRFICLCAAEIASLRESGMETGAIEDRMNARARDIRIEIEH